ncbi:MAG TPA: TetR/AcrR family transcriptional regulator [Pseudomonadales bacterium]
MGHSQAEKALNRQRILEAAAAQIREQGLESISVGKLMQSVGLTHGGFYNHFASRSELLREALERALQDAEAHARSRSRGPSRNADALEAYVRSYLSRAHRDAPASGCAIAALLSDVGRAAPELRGTVEQRIEGLIARMAELLDDERRTSAIVAVAAMVGALGLARVMTDRERSDAVLRTVREFIVELGRQRRADD